ncbi:MAG TPA: YqcC family protein [Chromatiales bacterium]|nr:YqcC family protein [Thiotrichales bacterium]HIP69496.1 YqcC family protein [Chromatiales bacterium]
MDHQEKAKQLLHNIESELKALGVWESTAPPVDALNNTNPFCCDTLELHQWLQWVFLPKINALIEQGQSLPGQCDIASYAEVIYAKSNQDRSELVEHIRAFDLFCTGN